MQLLDIKFVLEMGSLKIFVVIFLFERIIAQENAGTNVSPSLQECYNDTLITTRDFRLPSTITALIDLIRQIEDGNTNQNARELSFKILHRYDQIKT